MKKTIALCVLSLIALCLSSPSASKPMPTPGENPILTFYYTYHLQPDASGNYDTAINIDIDQFDAGTHGTLVTVGTDLLGNTFYFASSIQITSPSANLLHGVSYGDGFDLDFEVDALDFVSDTTGAVTPWPLYSYGSHKVSGMKSISNAGGASSTAPSVLAEVSGTGTYELVLTPDPDCAWYNYFLYGTGTSTFTSTSNTGIVRVQYEYTAD